MFYRIGVDVEIVASYKTPTTPDITAGICKAIEGILTPNNIQPADILSINIGTTHFINAIIECDKSKLDRVAVLRLCGPFCREVAPFEEFPPSLRAVIQGHVGYLSGGVEVDGRRIGDIDEGEVLDHARQIRERADKAVVVIGVFSPLDVADITQEEKTKRILEKALPGVNIVVSRSIGNLGFIERENASILNASIVRCGRAVVRNIQLAVMKMGLLACPLYLTQNDGTVMDAHTAASLPIKTFSSGATNSLIGAVFLAGLHLPDSEIDLEKSQVIMVDIGGTSSDFAALSPSGFPRQSTAVVKVGGVRTAFAMPEVLSLGLGGGSIVHVDGDGNVTVGPDSVGYRLQNTAQCFGGDVLTATDIAVAASNSGDSLIKLQWKTSPDDVVVEGAREYMCQVLTRGIERMKASNKDVIALMVGGGSMIQIDEPKCVKRCIKPRFSNVANAVGAAIAKVAGESDCIQIPQGRTSEQMVENVKEQAVRLAIKNGAQPDSVEIVEIDILPVPYTSVGAVRIVAKAVGELGWQKQDPKASGLVGEVQNDIKIQAPSEHVDLNGFHPMESPLLEDPHLEFYTPQICKSTKQWIVSEIDLAFIAEGVGILGTGGGGSSRSAYLNAIRSLRSAGVGKMRIIDPKYVPDDGQVVLVAWTGSPSVSSERLSNGNELPTALKVLGKFLHIDKYAAIMGPEIGGSNGMCAFPIAASMDTPVIDADTMGRAFPKVDMALPYVYGQASPCPAVFTDARGNVQLIAETEDHHRFETMSRAACVELGLSTAMALNPLSAKVVRSHCCHRSLSSAWFIGREIYLARLKKRNPATAVLSMIPGGRFLYSGKVTEVSRKVEGGFTIGTATLQYNDENGQDIKTDKTRLLQLKYQNEFLYATLVNPDGSLEPVCTTPDLISVLDQDGSALQTHELRYGLLLDVIALPAHPLWMTDEGKDAAGPRAFSLNADYVPYASAWKEPESVIERYSRITP
ncbi:hypothetical protein UA08_08053 [Talaromyces atroroseus]|uniref:Hydantoinase A/oxoprolinase domain-containing protein n=1 Tax=Talaromyces atroroseus TaxID=1441469 RepID=A0A225A734_TALAT|nr:hypothetical protein UA08_08053 [Talaromyces atroroseus]OKL56411.1 hypothetical protein UA08_08053 [Talaromyces atroroseus]